MEQYDETVLLLRAPHRERDRIKVLVAEGEPRL
jgi:hypothetical protein